VRTDRKGAAKKGNAQIEEKEQQEKVMHGLRERCADEGAYRRERTSKKKVMHRLRERCAD
jgi:hypothetical protein